MDVMAQWIYYLAYNVSWWYRWWHTWRAADSKCAQCLCPRATLTSAGTHVEESDTWISFALLSLLMVTPRLPPCNDDIYSFESWCSNFHWHLYIHHSQEKAWRRMPMLWSVYSSVDPSALALPWEERVGMVCWLPWRRPSRSLKIQRGTDPLSKKTGASCKWWHSSYDGCNTLVY